MLPKGAIPPWRTLLALLHSSFSESLAPRAVSSALWSKGPLGVFPHVIHMLHRPQSLLHSRLFIPCCPGHCGLSLRDSRILRSGMVI